ncbi:hypothetical protein [Mucilaginibacter segetis]|uniref:Protochlamydia outer membrane protein domain-containing protein n=1 Tax=Mucilaginibacter segetis TaxID=2793071 RepID=A0A934PUM2_9SPHI|nr:hypothetical protein [Mucilaginibacter segetis]MBK0379876.1 hypothetical protein [Mucilaginibacter segetis]
MKRPIIICLGILLNAGLLFAQAIQKKVQLNLSTGYQQQDLKWSIAGNQAGQNPNIYSELQWKKVGGQLIAGELQWNFYKKLSLTAGFSHVYIGSGTVSDNDYNGDNRTNRVYSELFNADKGFTRSWSAGVGYMIFNTQNFSLIPYAGYGTNKQSLFLLDRSGDFPDLNSTYNTDWKGPFLKATATAKLAARLKLTADITYNQADYKSKADWNLIQTFQHPVSYRHTAKGYGITANAGLGYAISRNIGMHLSGGYFSWQTGKGVDELFLASGGSEKTQLNGVDHSGYRVALGVELGY